MTEATPAARHGEDPGARLVGSDRVLAVLTELAGHPDGISLDELSRELGSPKPTVHRALASLRRAGFAGQDGRGTYVLGDEFLRLAFTHHEARPAHLRVAPALRELAERFCETAHYAVLDGRDVVYRAKVDPPVGAIRLSSVIGGRNPAHSTAVGKLLLAYTLPDVRALRAWLAAGPPLERRTARTKVSVTALSAELALVRAQGYATEEEENEPGICCLAVPVNLSSTTVPDGGVSVSAVSYRTPLRLLVEGLPHIRAAVAPLQVSAAS